MAMIGGERAELAAGSVNPVPPALQRRMDDVFAALFASRPSAPGCAADADDRMRIAPPHPEQMATVAVAEAAPRWTDAEPGEVPAAVAG